MRFCLRSLPMRPIAIFLILLALVLGTAGCNPEELLLPKPRSFPRVLYPERDIQSFTPPDCPFAFSFPAYALVEQKTLFFDDAPAHPCWFDLYLPAFDGRLHFSYYPLINASDWEAKRDQAFNLVGFHNKRASNIVEHRIDRSETLGGMAFAINGPAASPYQFFLTDSTTHFVRAALYFNTQSRPDSLQPIVDFVTHDIEQLISSFQWTERQ